MRNYTGAIVSGKQPATKPSEREKGNKETGKISMGGERNYDG
jgi:hypothetical protein